MDETTRGEVLHNINPILGWLYLHQQAGTTPSERQIAAMIEKLNIVRELAAER